MKILIIISNEENNHFIKEFQDFISNYNIDTQIIDYSDKTMPSFKVDKYNRTVYINNKQICLNRLEFNTLYFLYSNRNQVLSKEQIYEAVWKNEKETNTHAINCVIYQIRRKIGKQYIKTHIGIGYQFIEK